MVAIRLPAVQCAASPLQRGWKLYSFHAPEVECIGKGKARAPYEFGVKVSIVTTNACAPGGQFVLHAAALPGNPNDGHTLRAAIEPLIGHMKEEGHLGRCYLKGHAGDAANAILTAAGYNFRRILAWLRILLRLILYALMPAPSAAEGWRGVMLTPSSSTATIEKCASCAPGWVG